MAETFLGLRVVTTSDRVMLYSLHKDYKATCSECMDGHKNPDQPTACVSGRLGFLRALGAVRFANRNSQPFMLVLAGITSVEVVTLSLKPKPANPLEDEKLYDSVDR